MLRPISNFKPNGWHHSDNLDGRMYRAGAAIDGVVDILQGHLAEGASVDVQKALFACSDLLSRVRDELFEISNIVIVNEIEGV